ncbi:MAG: hypothetical protein JKX84_06500 [Flavobacteriales bacterium]|nr:hypothetical protein [Flavobacteriales bacterium]
MFILLNGWAFFSYAQPANSSPYGRYGLGNMNNGANVRSAGVGGISIAMREDSIPYLVNFLNPASYTSLGFTSFDIGVYGNVATLSTSTESVQVNKANLSYFTLGFPVTKWWGGAFGLREFSSVNYSVSDFTEGPDSLFGNTAYKFQGNGGVNQVFIGIGLKPFKNFSIGLNASYLFGRMNRIQRLEFSNTNFFNVKSDRFTDVGGFYLDYGLQYSLGLKKGKHVLIFGSTFAHPMKVRANSTFLAQTYTLTSFGEDLFRDTITFQEVKGGSIQTPWKYGFGLSWKAGEKWLIGVEHNQELWSGFKDVYGKNDSLADAWRTSAGIEFKPSLAYTNRGFLAYFGKMHYRIGGYYAMSQYKLNGTQLPEYGITFGFGFPLKRSRSGTTKFLQSMINVAVEWGQRGTTDKSLLLENYWNFKLGFTLNDRWFIKRKYE